MERHRAMVGEGVGSRGGGTTSRDERIPHASLIPGATLCMVQVEASEQAAEAEAELTG